MLFSIFTSVTLISLSRMCATLVTLDPLKPLAYRTLDLKIFANMFCHTTQNTP
eukprot:COSAG01_NODE_22504_length_852_cov_257.120850_2_plen_52_part_01